MQTYLQFSLRSALLLMLVVAVFSDWFRPGRPNAKIEAVGTPVNSIPAGRSAVTFRMTNTSLDPLWIYGHDLASPFMQIQAQRLGQWHNESYGYCGTGAGFHRLGPGESTAFLVTVRGGAERLKTAVSIHNRAGGSREPKVIWSAPAPCS